MTKSFHINAFVWLPSLVYLRLSLTSCILLTLQQKLHFLDPHLCPTSWSYSCQFVLIIVMSLGNTKNIELKDSDHSLNMMLRFFYEGPDWVNLLPHLVLWMVLLQSLNLLKCAYLKKCACFTIFQLLLFYSFISTVSAPYLVYSLLATRS